MARIFVSGAVSITMTDTHARDLPPGERHPCAALPALTVQTPSRRSAADSCRTTLCAPRTLNEPIG
jgi:hypothetical protein